MSNVDPMAARAAAKSKSTPVVAASNTPKTMSADFIPQPGLDFVATPAIQDLTDRALAYLNIGYAIHLSGPAGTGKTTLAMHIAAQLGRACTLLHGDDEMRGSDLVGRDSGYRRQSVRDNYVSSILKTEETVSVMWSSNRLTTACEQGHTLIYDEFTRSPATANNTLLSVLEEGILNIPSSGQEKGYIKVHPNFRAIFTSNPEEYVGVHKSQDALLDRMITLEVSHQDRETEIAIVAAKSKRNGEDASIIVDIIRSLRERLGGPSGPTIRAALAIANIADFRKCEVSANDSIFCATCQDLLYFNATRQSTQKISRQDIQAIVQKYASRPAKSRPTSYADSSSDATRCASADLGRKIDQSFHQITSDLNAASNSQSYDASLSSASFADHSKDVITPSVLESLADRAKIDDQVKEFGATRGAVPRSLPKPPSFEANPSRLATNI